MRNGRTELDEYEKTVLKELKEHLTDRVGFLLESGVRPAIIQIELEWHIKNLLKGD